MILTFNVIHFTHCCMLLNGFGTWYPFRCCSAVKHSFIRSTLKWSGSPMVYIKPRGIRHIKHQHLTMISTICLSGIMTAYRWYQLWRHRPKRSRERPLFIEFPVFKVILYKLLIKYLMTKNSALHAYPATFAKNDAHTDLALNMIWLTGMVYW